MAILRLSDDDNDVLSGDRGTAARLCMGIMVEYGRALGAPNLISISRAHIDGCLYQGKSGLEFAQRLNEGQASVVVDTTLNVGGVDLLHPHLNRGDRARINEARKLMHAYTSMGCRPTWTCAPYQLHGRPVFGEDVAWAESNAIAFINSVVGARSDRYGDFIDICAAITGRVPNYGLHRAENRRGQVVFDIADVSRAWSQIDLFWPLLGLLVGREVGSLIPVLIGLNAAPSEDDLKAFGAAAASAGSVAMFHVVGVTPEAPTLDDALQAERALQTITVTGDMLRGAAITMTSRRTGKLTAISLGTPHFSISEFAELVRHIQGRKCRPEVEFYVSTSRDILADIEKRGWADTLRDFGAEIVVDTCTYLTPIIKRRSGVVMTNSAKWAYYAPGNLGFEIVLAPLSACVRSAISGEIKAESLPIA